MRPVARPLPSAPRGSWRRLLALVLVVCLLPIGSGVALAGCGDDTKASKTEIATRLGLAYVAYKRYIYTPAQEGSFQRGAQGRTAAIAKAALAGAFTARMLQKAKEEADQDPQFRKYTGKIAAAGASLAALTTVLKGGDALSVDQITGGLGSLDSLVSQGRDLGINPDLGGDVSVNDLVNPLK